MSEIARHIAEKGDLAHLTLFLWASASSGLAVLAVRELTRLTRRFEDFVDAIARLNRSLAERTDR
ncbi:MAG: hypothetical protein KDI98_07630 [Hyphomicrobiaceae bacterium]|nr:hypothetical protein [Hyphomicrobiaceae bacterium]